MRGVTRRRNERSVSTGEDRGADAEDVARDQRIWQRARERRIAMDGGDADQVGVVVRDYQRENVIVPRVTVNDYGGGALRRCSYENLSAPALSPVRHTAGMKSSPRHASEAPFRPEIEGLRGLAVGLVVAAHAGLPIPGAALGPDIFFVLSGYLIVGILLRGLEAGDGINFREFYARRIRRIAPALAATILLTVGVVALLNDPATLPRTAKDGAAALAGAANITFGLQAVDYFSSTEPSPLLPLWSIGVEEQFYLLVPLLLGIAWKIGRRRAILLTLAIIAIGSTAVAALLTPTEPIWAYYLLPTRAYGLAAGGLLALLETRALASNALRRAPLAPIGLAAIVALTLLLPGEKGYPGIAGPLAGVASVALVGGMATIGLRGTVSATG